jgi:hypothetical protein
MLTLFSIPKAFDGQIGAIQRNAIRSWVALPNVQVVLVGDAQGVSATASNFGVDHIGGVAMSTHGTPQLDDAFRRVEAVAARPLRCFVNADVVLLDDLLPAVSAVRDAAQRFLVIGKTIDVQLDGELDLARREARDDLGLLAQARGRSRGATAIDYFVFTPALFDPIPPFAVGRAGFDNWFVWRARQRAMVVDASSAVRGVHQHHDYGHVEGGQNEAHFGVEASRNLELAGGKGRLYTIYDASHRLDPDLRLQRNLGAAFRAREKARKVSWKLRRR